MGYLLRFLNLFIAIITPAREREVPRRESFIEFYTKEQGK